MKIVSKGIIIFLIAINICLFIYLLLHGKTIAIFQPAGFIADKQRDLFYFIIALGLSIVIPTIIATYFMVWKYRVENTKASYTPDWDTNKPIQIALFSLLCGVIAIVAVMDWQSAHDLSPFKAIPAKNQLNIEVVALRWKWLFIYPDLGIASVNYLVFPQKTALNFHITADAPMNGFWIPQLGGQVYAMNGMSMPYHLMADRTGTFRGQSSNISGDGFASMVFSAKSITQDEFNTWVSDIKSSAKPLDLSEYNKLTKPSENTPPTFYVLSQKDLYNTIVMKYMSPTKAYIKMPMHNEGN